MLIFEILGGFFLTRFFDFFEIVRGMIRDVPSTLRLSRTSSGTALRSEVSRVDARDVLGASRRGGDGGVARGDENPTQNFQNSKFRFFQNCSGNH